MNEWKDGSSHPLRWPIYGHLRVNWKKEFNVRYDATPNTLFLHFSVVSVSQAGKQNFRRLLLTTNDNSKCKNVSFFRFPFHSLPSHFVWHEKSSFCILSLEKRFPMSSNQYLSNRNAPAEKGSTRRMHTSIWASIFFFGHQLSTGLLCKMCSFHFCLVQQLIKKCFVKSDKFYETDVLLLIDSLFHFPFTRPLSSSSFLHHVKCWQKMRYQTQRRLWSQHCTMFPYFW